MLEYFDRDSYIDTYQTIIEHIITYLKVNNDFKLTMYNIDYILYDYIFDLNTLNIFLKQYNVKTIFCNESYYIVPIIE